MPTPHPPRQARKGADSPRLRKAGQAATSNGDRAPVAETRRPPTIPFRSFKIALSVFKQQGPVLAKFDRSIWSNKLYSTNLREILEAFRFLGLMDAASAPTTEFARLVSACETPAWPAELRRLLERSFEPLLRADMSTLTAGGLLKVVRTIYQTENDDTRRCCNFFIHAARDAAMDLAPYALNSSRSRWTAGSLEPQQDTIPASDLTGAPIATGQQTIHMLLARLPGYETGWPDDIKRYWFGAYHELVLRLRE